MSRAVDYTCVLSFSGITIRFNFPEKIALPREFKALQCDDASNVDATYDICLLSEPLKTEGEPSYVQGDKLIYRLDGGWLRIYMTLTTGDGRQVACFMGDDGRNKLYYPASRWSFYSESLHCTHLICGELLLLMHDAFLLHSSVVQIDGKTVLFSGPSGIGKSTQAGLWAGHLGAEVLNGDRCVVMKKADGFYGGGSIWAGTSGIYRPEQAPIAGIFLLRQAEENHIRRPGKEAFMQLFSQTTINSWDREFMDKVLQLYTELFDSVPVYCLDCRPDREAAELAYHTLF